MEYHCTHIHWDWLMWDDSGIMPSVLAVIIHQEHMISKSLSKLNLAHVLRLL